MPSRKVRAPSPAPTSPSELSQARDSWSRSPDWDDPRDCGHWNKEDESVSMENVPEVIPGKYLRGTVIGQGGWSTVIKVKRVVDGKLFAGKKSQTPEQLYKESKRLRKWDHPNIVKFMELYKQDSDEENNLLIMELCAKGTLQMRIEWYFEPMSMPDIVSAIIQIADALVYMHGKGFFHADIKPRNIFVRRYNPINVALGDCSDCKVHGKYEGPRTGTSDFWSPDMVAYNRHSGKSDDIWALGVTLLAMMGQKPEKDKTDVGKFQYPSRCANYAQELMRLNPGNALVDLVSKMLIKKVRERPTAEKCLEMATKIMEGMSEDEKLAASVNGLGLTSPEKYRPVEAPAVYHW
ncbi:kinase-like protein [Trichoderma gracile]